MVPQSFALSTGLLRANIVLVKSNVVKRDKHCNRMANGKQTSRDAEQPLARPHEHLWAADRRKIWPLYRIQYTREEFDIGWRHLNDSGRMCEPDSVRRGANTRRVKPDGVHILHQTLSALKEVDCQPIISINLPTLIFTYRTSSSQDLRPQ